MAEFKPKVPVVQTGPTVQVDITPANPLPVGLVTFQLVVVDDSGNESAPATIALTIKDLTKPTAVLEAVNAAGASMGTVIPAGVSFFLSGAKSTDLLPGKIKEYRFMLLGS